MEQGQPESPVTFDQALVLFELTEADLDGADSRNRVDEKRRQLLLTWHPHRYASLTNKPKT
jgi:hypothetical protein